ncbi:probable LRR receptor-like serine/threonine-protein kinase At5g59680 [Neltuma alba]|uniref:probable LRR receptor-like serine/threonine-protein kinase At5g59680 n=1 Tax=Neltuma alba TaxID=207710 RepID=UPI0010A46ABA|nr:probable LRR receptor-like serine/threonine-protein kinase At5g59680 [Prosopis alba]
MAIHNVLLLLSSLLLTTLTPSLSSSPTFISIDCGSNSSIADGDIFQWDADDSYVQNGDSHVVQYTSTVPLYMSETAMSTLRAFPTSGRTATPSKSVRDRRYPDDAYDRIWRAEGGFVLVENLVNEAPSIDASKAEDQPPLSVLRTATTTTGTLWGIVLNTDLPSTSEPIYITAYFSEVTRLRSNETRSIQVEINQVPYSQPFVPPFGAVSELRIANRNANSNTSVAVFADRSSNLPPLLNAYEVYTVSGALTDGTDSDDVEGLAALQRNFGVLQKWSGDPCLPSSFSWNGLNATPMPPHESWRLWLIRTTAGLQFHVDLNDLHNNSLSGPIPRFLGSFPKLKLL